MLAPGSTYLSNGLGAVGLECRFYLAYRLDPSTIERCPVCHGLLAQRPYTAGACSMRQWPRQTSKLIRQDSDSDIEDKYGETMKISEIGPAAVLSKSL